jgi:pimeloyl-ACP methyl ester carboxylesterase
VTHWLCKLLQRFNADLGVDADDLLRMLDTFPDVMARRAFLRTLRSAVDWRGQAITMLDRCYLTQSVPTLLVWGSRDAIIPMEHARVASSAMPNSRMEIFDGAGHFPFRTDPERFVAAVEGFIQETKPAPHSPVEWRDLLRRGPSEPLPVAFAR